mgnify:CR=1 FL=1|jgi:ABC-type dipeptide/oligopeptide/nickel transport system permease subunit
MESKTVQVQDVPQAKPEDGSIGKGFYGDTLKRLKRNKVAMVSLVVIVLIALMAIFAPYVAPYDPYVQDLSKILAPPSAEHWLGTDDLGRDILSRVIHGARVSLTVGLVAESIALALGVVIGAVAGYFGSWVDNLISRIMEVFASFPQILFAMGIMFAMGPGILNIFIAIGLVGWTGVARIVRGQVMQLKEMEYVQAARATGAGTAHIIFRHLIPNCLPTIIIVAAMNIPANIMTEASLSFIGLGVQLPHPSWGSMVSIGRKYIRMAPHFSVYPGIAIIITVLAFTMLGDGLRDALDPRMKDSHV